MKTYTVYGEKNGENRLVFRSITWEDWTRRGEKNAREHGFKSFELTEQWTLANNGAARQVIRIA